MHHHTDWRSPLLAAIAAGALMFASGCKAEECVQMHACCGEVKGMKGLGQACGPLTESTKEPDTCRSVTETVRYMLEDRGAEVPLSCKPMGSGKKAPK